MDEGYFLNESIYSVVPHRGKMCLLNRILSHQPEFTECEVRIGADSIFVGEQGVPSWVGIEYMAQAVAAHDGLSASGRDGESKIGFLISIRKAVFFADFFYPGQVLRIQVQCLWGDQEFFSFQGKIQDAQTNSVLAEAQLNFFRPKNLKEFQEGKNV